MKLTTLEAVFSADQAKAILRIDNGEDCPESYEAVDKWVRACYGSPSDDELKMAAYNAILEGYGVEAVRMEGAYVDAFHGDIVGTFVNMGDTYVSTIVLDSDSGEFLVTSYGDFVEALETEKDEENSWD